MAGGDSLLVHPSQPSGSSLTAHLGNFHIIPRACRLMFVAARSRGDRTSCGIRAMEGLTNMGLSFWKIRRLLPLAVLAPAPFPKQIITLHDH